MTKTIWIINQYASTPETGMGGRHYYLAKELVKQGYKVYLIAAGYTHLLHSPPVMDKTYKIEAVDGFYFVWINVAKYKGAHDKKRLWNWFSFAWKLLKLPKFISDVPDTILYSSPSLIPFVAAERLSKKISAKLVFEVRDLWPLTLVEIGGYSFKHPFIRLMQWVEDKAYLKSDAVLSNLPNAREHMVDRGLDAKKFSWIPNGLDLNEVSQAQPLSEKTLAALPKNKFIVGYVGTLGLANALEYFIDAAATVKDGSLAWVLVGKGKDKLKLEAKCEALKLSNVYFVDAIPKAQVQTMLSMFDVCYIGWRRNLIYRFGVAANKIPEYFYSGKPIVHSFSGFGDAVHEANAGLSVPAEASQAVADAVVKLKSMSFEQRSKFGENGRNYALKNHDYAKLAEKLISIID